jgi:hypothetical protein
LKVEPADAADILARFEPAPLRGQLLRFAAGFTVVNDAYNSNPLALTAMAEALSRTPGARRRLLVAGEMKELGATSAELHRQAGEKIAALGNIDFLVGVNGDSRYLVEGARAAGMSSDSCRFFDKRKAPPTGSPASSPRATGFCKASRGVALETVLEPCRRATHWRDAAPVAKGKGQRRALHPPYEWLQPYWGPLNVFRYTTFRTAFASMTALFLCVALGPWLIQKLRQFQIGQYIREEGPKSHQKKAGTPTMGGVLIIISIVIRRCCGRIRATGSSGWRCSAWWRSASLATSTTTSK